jgi:hypothetical protein
MHRRVAEIVRSGWCIGLSRCSDYCADRFHVDFGPLNKSFVHLYVIRRILILGANTGPVHERIPMHWGSNMYQTRDLLLLICMAKGITNSFKADRGDRIRRTPYERTALVQPVETVADQPHWILGRSRGDCLPPFSDLPLLDLRPTVGPYDVYRTSL